MKSKTKLFKFFKEKYGVDLNLKSTGISDETYGPRSFVYVYNSLTTLGVDREQAIKDLVAAGFPKPGIWGSNPEYTTGQGLEIRVSYFKGKNWDV